MTIIFCLNIFKLYLRIFYKYIFLKESVGDNFVDIVPVPLVDTSEIRPACVLRAEVFLAAFRFSTVV